MQQDYDLWHAKRAMAAELRAIEQVAARQIEKFKRILALVRFPGFLAPFSGNVARPVLDREFMPNTRVSEIDLLRFFAAMSVVFYHYTFRGYAADQLSILPYPLFAPVSKYGYLGVELFFMISGFVILMSASSGNLKKFVVSRIVRLYPAFWICCSITFATILAIGSPRYFASFDQYLVNMTMLSGFFHVPSIDGAYWSLFVELRFYALVAIVLIFNKIEQAEVLLVFWLMVSCVLELAPIAFLHKLLIVDYSALFIAGSTFFLIWSRGISLKRSIVIVLCWLLAMNESLARLRRYEEHYNTHFNTAVVAACITAFFLLMLLISLKRTGFMGRVGNRWILAGALSYPVYLLHQFVGYAIFNAAYPRTNPHVLLWGTICGLLAAAYLVQLVERRVSLPMKGAINKLADTIQRLALHSGWPHSKLVEKAEKGRPK